MIIFKSIFNVQPTLQQMKVIIFLFAALFLTTPTNSQSHNQIQNDQKLKLSPPGWLQGIWYEKEALNSMNSIKVTGNNIFFSTEKGNHFNAVRSKHDVIGLMDDLKKDNNPDEQLHLKEELPRYREYIISYGIENNFVTVQFVRGSIGLLIVDFGDHKQREFIRR